MDSNHQIISLSWSDLAINNKAYLSMTQTLQDMKLERVSYPFKIFGNLLVNILSILVQFLLH